MAFGAVGCGEESRFFVVQNQAPSDMCEISAKPDNPFKGTGRLDAALIGPGETDAYTIFPLLQNDLPRAGQEGAPEPNRLTVEAFMVRLELDRTAPAAARKVFDDLAASETGKRFLAFEQPFAATIDPGGSRISSHVDAFPAEVVRRLREAGAFEGVAAIRTMVNLRVRGRGLSRVVETPEFRFPLEICDGCLARVVGACPLQKLENAGHGCNIAQDQVVDCCTEARGVRCPASVSTTTPAAP
ncbi:MAG TPA: hypothetical protein VGF45_17945 [Polyangia bacterium]